MKPRELRSKSVGTKVSEAELRVLESRAEWPDPVLRPIRNAIWMDSAVQAWGGRLGTKHESSKIVL